MVHEGRVRAVAGGHDEEGRPLFVVSAGDHVVNEQLLRRGLAWRDRQRESDEEQYRRLEKRARDAERKIWAESSPVPPWVWRREQERKPRGGH